MKCFYIKFLIHCEAHCQKILNSFLYISKTVRYIKKNLKSLFGLVFVNIVHKKTAFCWKKRQSENSHISVTNSDTAKIPTDLKSEKYFCFQALTQYQGKTWYTQLLVFNHDMSSFLCRVSDYFWDSVVYSLVTV